MAVGCDIDGVASVGFVPDEDYILVSGRLTHEWARTVAEYGTSVPIYLRPFGVDGDRDEAANWKAKIVNWLRLTKFYEDDEWQAGIIKGKCPWCDVILVKVKNEARKDGERGEIHPGDEVRGGVSADDCGRRSQEGSVS